MLAYSQDNWKNETNIEKLTRFAIEAATDANWEEAAKINKRIVKLAGYDTEALNRLARAQACTGCIDKALRTYKKVLAINPCNPIAKRNIEKIAKINSKDCSINGKQNGYSIEKVILTNHHLTNFFLHEPGKTKIINLINLASPSILASLECGEKLEMNIKKHSICIASSQNTYLGALPDDLAHKIITYINGGNKYEAYVKYSTTKTLTIIITEVLRSEKYTNQPSFQLNPKLEEKKRKYIN